MLTLITCFHGRHRCVERILRCFLNQNYPGDITLLLYNNSRIAQELGPQLVQELPSNRKIILINNYKDLQTGEEYTNVGDIFRDALTYVPASTKVINFFDSDDIFLPSHATEGMIGWALAISVDNHTRLDTSMVAYKPYYSYYLDGDDSISLSHNNMEPSVFVDFEYVKEKGFRKVAASYHQEWLSPLQQQNKISQPVTGPPTLIYNWGNKHDTHKISGLGDIPTNFRAHREYEQDHGDNVLSPAHQREVQRYYDLIKSVNA